MADIRRLGVGMVFQKKKTKNPQKKRGRGGGGGGEGTLLSLWGWVTPREGFAMGAVGGGGGGGGGGGERLCSFKRNGKKTSE